MVERVTTLFIVVGARERRQSDEETAGDGGVFNVFNVVSFTKRNGGDGAATLRSLAQRARRPEALSRPVVNGGGGFAWSRGWRR
jgi:hypothetical protein